MHAIGYILPSLLILTQLSSAATPQCSTGEEIPCQCSPSDTSIGPFKKSPTHSVNSTTLQNCDKIRKLDLANLGIQTLEQDAFIGVPLLTWLSLRNGLFTKLPEGVFAPLHSLIHLDMTNANLGLANGADEELATDPIPNTDPIPKGTFATLANLKFLLIGNMWLQAIPDLTGLQELVKLDLSDNTLEYVPPLPSMPRLTWLILLGNYIGRIENDAFAKLPNLETLNLKYNRLQTLRNHTFTGLQSLRNLTLTGNLIFYIDFDAFTPLVNLNTFSMQTNPSKCSLVGVNVNCTCESNIFDESSQLFGGDRAACVCPAGQYLYSTQDVSHLQNSYSQTCLQCNLGTYNAVPGATSCTSCPGKQSERYTAHVGSDSVNDCTDNPSVEEAEEDAETARNRFIYAGIIGLLLLLCVGSFALYRFKHHALRYESEYKQISLENMEREIEYLRHWHIKYEDIKLDKKLASGSEG